ncbi:ketopantoate reductase family protein [Litoribrevibacter albus]|uniref:2-dehydropantoate 2-reductase n=1 Tax=Litoribrevibacter albus TaxID=1473156 RepID=A0AA37S7S8_9GAMM|nr:2-dehydropantoate 2-reductase [Litoribrevibacter albus]GLQ29704.1 2-dehydropantoate 2-reductase [Litoribrevibacter albus]
MQTSLQDHQWHIAGPGAIGLLIHSFLYKANPDLPPILVNRSLQGTFTTYNLTNCDQKIETLPVQWFEKQHHISHLIVTTKSHQVIDCIKALSSYLQPDATILLLHNGLGVQQQAIDTWPDFHFYLGTTTEGAWKQADNIVVHAGTGDTRLGNFTNKQPQWWLQSELRDIGFMWQDNILAQLHLKVAINAAINPLTILFECQNGQLLASPDRLSLMRALCEETYLVLTAEGYPITDLVSKVTQIAERTSANYSSSYQDWANQRKTELFSMNGYIQTLGKKHNIKTPTHDKVMAEVAKKAIL